MIKYFTTTNDTVNEELSVLSSHIEKLIKEKDVGVLSAELLNALRFKSIKFKLTSIKDLESLVKYTYDFSEYIIPKVLHDYLNNIGYILSIDKEANVLITNKEDDSVVLSFNIIQSIVNDVSYRNDYVFQESEDWCIDTYKVTDLIRLQNKYKENKAYVIKQYFSLIKEKYSNVSEDRLTFIIEQLALLYTLRTLYDIDFYIPEGYVNEYIVRAYELISVYHDLSIDSYTSISRYMEEVLAISDS